jgi:predicted nucleotidyltransferase
MNKENISVKDIKNLRNSGRLIFEVVSGSHSYGLQSAESDTDLRGIFVIPANERISLSETVEEIGDEKQNEKYYELKKFFLLASQCNPNIIERLWTPEDCVRLCSPAMEKIIANRDKFLSQKAFDTFSGYAYSQIKKASGQNKMVRNPQPDKPPEKTDSCWFIPPASKADYPCRPVPLKNARIKLEHCHTAALEHVPFVYRLYDYGSQAKGVFRGDMLVCESIPLEDECGRFRGLLIYNHQEYDKALKDWHRYHDWKKNRNETRWKDQEGEEFQYDRKNMMHCVRLLISGENLLRHACPLVRCEGRTRQYLLDIRAGKFSYEQIMADVEKRMGLLEILRVKSKLPADPDMKSINRLFLEIARQSD